MYVFYSFMGCKTNSIYLCFTHECKKFLFEKVNLIVQKIYENNNNEKVLLCI